MSQIDIAHQAEDKREAARDEKIEASERHPVEYGADEGLLPVEQPIEPVRPDPEHHPEEGGAGEQRQAIPNLTRRRRPRICNRKTHARCRRRCSLILGALWNSPSFMMARSRVLSCKMRMLAMGSPSTGSLSAR